MAPAPDVQLDAFAPQPAPDARAVRQRHLWLACWPEWEGPRVGGSCEVGQCVVYTEAGKPLYAYTELCRILEQRPDGSWLVEIAMGQVWGKAWHKNGTRLVLSAEEIWPPTRELRPLRRARARAEVA